MWKALPQFPGYSVSDAGQVRNDRTGLILKPQRNTSGYHIVSLPADGKWRSFRIHRLVAEAFLPPPQPGQTEVAHNDGARTNNAATNLRWATRTENQRDRRQHRTDFRGERCPNAKFSNDEAAELRAFIHQNPQINDCEMARRRGVSHSTIRSLRIGESYAEAL